MSFQEKSAIATLGGLLLVYGAYFAIVGRWMAASPVNEIAYQPLMFIAVVALVILAVVSHILIAVVNPKEADALDERDRLIGLRGERVGGYVLAVGVFAGLVFAMIEVDHFYVAQTLLLSLVLAQASDEASKIVLYRRGS
ncbi:MAG: hypothetical protein LC739_03140 [Actinobacteria bacterium]|nr:hypothetical protein [Actinomycetota bacterium]